MRQHTRAMPPSKIAPPRPPTTPPTTFLLELESPLDELPLPPEEVSPGVVVMTAEPVVEETTAELTMVLDVTWPLLAVTMTMEVVNDVEEASSGVVVVMKRISLLMRKITQTVQIV